MGERWTITIGGQDVAFSGQSSGLAAEEAARLAAYLTARGMPHRAEGSVVIPDADTETARHSTPDPHHVPRRGEG